MSFVDNKGGLHANFKPIYYCDTYVGNHCPKREGEQGD